MTASAQRRRSGAHVALLLALATCDLAATDDEVHCEEAAAHLAECCPGFDPRGFDCTAGPGCNSPKLLVDDGKCIERKGCEALVADGTCDRARFLAGTGPSVPDLYPVCR